MISTSRWLRTGQKRGDKRQDRDNKIVRHHVWSVARTGVGGDTPRQKTGGDRIAREVRGYTKPNR
eukprot:3914905-Pleurochrysis_carterae.AAC.1